MASSNSIRAPSGKKVDVDESVPIMETNSSSIVSKRSVEQKFYNEPHFLRHFVKKRKNRSPLINRGYWLRMKCIEHTVKQFCSKASKPNVVINLGAGFDALPFRLLSTEPELCVSTTFVDVDYEELLESKINTIFQNENVLRQLLGEIHEVNQNETVKLKTEKYWALACDLHDPSPLKKMIAEFFNAGAGYSILFVSEVATCYMEPEKVDELLLWASSLEDARFCLLEQQLPQGQHYPFASTMLRHFSKLKSPLRGIRRYSSIGDQKRRFMGNGWNLIRLNSLWEIWCEKGKDEIVSFDDRQYLDTVEAFDEWEEFALFACHYFLLVAETRNPRVSVYVSLAAEEHDHKSPQLLSSTNHTTEDTMKLSIPQRRFGVLYQSSSKFICYHGGVGAHRVNSTITLGIDAGTSNSKHAIPKDIEPRMCHTITKLNDQFDLLLTGGRASPDHVFSDCWLRLNGVWAKTSSLPVPLFRHCALKVDLGGNRIGVLIHGGRTAHGSASRETFLWVHSTKVSRHDSDIQLEEEAWVKVGNRSSLPHIGRFAAMMSSLHEHTHGVLIGGLTEGGVPVLTGPLTWDLVEEDGAWSLEFSAMKEGETSHLSDSAYLSRFGASIVACGPGYMIFGGICQNGIAPKDQNIILLKELARDVEQPGTTEFKVEKVGKANISPLLVGHSAICTGDKIILAGGGAICFSFGTHRTNDIIQVSKDGQISSTGFASINEVIGEPIHKPPKQETVQFCEDKKGKFGNSTTVPTINAIKSSQFAQVIQDASPVILSGLDFGCCKSAWTTEYLVEKIGERNVTIHQASTPNMSFQPGEKNFKYVNVQFGEFMTSVAAGALEYFRALSNKDTSTPANLNTDFPEIATDFQLPVGLDVVAQHLHSSVLRISGPVSMWLHYDVLANVLVQVRGSKTLILFPPSDIRHLDIRPGSSSSRLNVSELLKNEDPILRRTNPHKVVLNPGDALYIPPLWLHSATPNEGMSIAVNVFFRDLDEGYATGRDAYGNRDVQAYEDGRKDLAKIIKRFQNLPEPMSNFYIQRLALELDEHA